MTNEAKKYCLDDEKRNEAIAAKACLESYCFDMKKKLNGGDINKTTISESDRNAILEKCNDTIRWVDANQMAEKEEYEHRQKELEAICSPITTESTPSAGGICPTIEEIDD